MSDGSKCLAVVGTAFLGIILMPATKLGGGLVFGGLVLAVLVLARKKR